jgi:RimJ/RimL family protein N-acetyltransferase
MAEMQPPRLLAVLMAMADASLPQPYRLMLNTHLRDGTPIFVRTLRPHDRIQLARGFERLSTQSRRFRFLAPLRRLTSRQLSMLTEVDQVNHVAIGVRDMSRPDRPGVAVARFIRFEQDPAAAEFAITVIDEYQRRGLGTLLLQLLLDAARKLDVHALRGYVLPDNLAMIQLLNRFGASWSRVWGSVLTAELEVPGPVPARLTTSSPTP